MHLSVTCNFILDGIYGCLPEGGFIVIDAVGLTVYVMCCNAQMNTIVICLTSTDVSVNCPSVICLPNIALPVLWRDTTSEPWIPSPVFPILIQTIQQTLCLLSVLYFLQLYSFYTPYD